MNNILFKTLLLKGEAGNSIASIEKTATSGLVDTYTITLTDGSTTTFEVTNGANGQGGADGNGIVSIEKTSTVGNVDTYTITYTNGDSDTFTVTNASSTASGISFDPTNTSLPSTANTVQKAIEALAPPSVTVTLTLNGAKEDSITIKDGDNNTVGTCVFASGQTSGACQITIFGEGGSYKFISSVAKDTTTGTSDYEKTVTLTNATTQTVNVMPDNTFYWYGNFTDTYTWLYGSVSNLTENTNSVIITASSGVTPTLASTQDYTLSGTFKCDIKGLVAVSGECGKCCIGTYNATEYGKIPSTTDDGIFSVSCSVTNGKFMLRAYDPNSSMLVRRIWFEE